MQKKNEIFSSSEPRIFVELHERTIGRGDHETIDRGTQKNRVEKKRGGMDPVPYTREARNKKKLCKNRTPTLKIQGASLILLKGRRKTFLGLQTNKTSKRKEKKKNKISNAWQ